MSSTEHKEHCKRVFKAALWCLNSRVAYPEIFLREMAMTKDCDDVYNLSDLRKSIVQDMGENSMKRLVNYQEVVNAQDRSCYAIKNGLVQLY